MNKNKEKRLRDALERAEDVMRWLADSRPDCYGWIHSPLSVSPAILEEAEIIREVLKQCS
jgi:hypothetical protein